ncbi:MAG: FkbM family methyltransferase [Halobacteriaceae archaeon]
MSELEGRLNKDTVFYNVGARWGIFSLFAMECGVPGDSIHDFEADQYNFKILEKNHLGADVNINHCFVGNEDTEDTIRLDSYCRENTLPDIVKIDVEGAEYNVIQGGEDTLSKSRPELYIEMHPGQILDGKQQDIISELRNTGYDIEVKRLGPLLKMLLSQRKGIIWYMQNKLE